MLLNTIVLHTMIRTLNRFIKLNTESNDLNMQNLCSQIGQELLYVREHNLIIARKVSEKVISALPGDSIYMYGYAAEEAMKFLKGRSDYKKFGKAYNTCAVSSEESEYCFSIIEKLLGKNDSHFHYLCGERGIFQGLYDMQSILGTGFDIKVRNINIKQNTIELAENYSINPYCAYSFGCGLFVLSDNNDKELKEQIEYENIYDDYLKNTQKIKITRIGVLTKDRQMQLDYDGTKALLNNPLPDELLRLLTDEEKQMQ